MLQDKQNGKKFAVKAVKWDMIDEKYENAFQNELKILKLFNSNQFVVKFFEEKPQTSISYNTTNYNTNAIILENGICTLEELINADIDLEIPVILYIFVNIVKGNHFFKSLRIIIFAIPKDCALRHKRFQYYHIRRL